MPCPSDDGLLRAPPWFLVIHPSMKSMPSYMARRPSLSCSLPIACTFHHCLKWYAPGTARACIPRHTASPSMLQRLCFSVCPTQPTTIQVLLSLHLSLLSAVSTRKSFLNLQAPRVGITVSLLHSQNPLFRFFLTYYIDAVEFYAYLYPCSLSNSRRVRPCSPLAFSTGPGAEYSPHHHWLNWTI